MVLRVKGDPSGFQQVAQDNAEAMQGIAERGRGRGAIHHAFYIGDGEVLVVDEWDSAESFKSFFEDEAPNIGPLMEQAGMHPTEPEFYEKVDSADQF
jgi:hypothetical protein